LRRFGSNMRYQQAEPNTFKLGSKSKDLMLWAVGKCLLEAGHLKASERRQEFNVCREIVCSFDLELQPFSHRKISLLPFETSVC